MKASFDPEADAVYLRFAKGKVARTEEARPGIILDYDDEGRIVGIEILHASQTLPDTTLKEFAIKK